MIRKIVWLVNRDRWSNESALWETFDGFFDISNYTATIEGVDYSYFDEPEIQPSRYWDNAPYDFVDYAAIYHAKKFFGHLPRGTKATGYLAYPIFYPGWWYKPWEWLIKFPYRVRWFLRNTRGPVYAGIQVSAGWSTDTILPSPWMVKYCAWVWRILAKGRLSAYAFWSWDAFDGLMNHPKLIRAVKEL